MQNLNFLLKKKENPAGGFLKIIWANVYLLASIYAAVQNLAAVEQNCGVFLWFICGELNIVAWWW